MERDFEKLRTVRAEEEEKLRTLEAQRATAATDLARLKTDLAEISEMRRTLSTEIVRIRPVKEIEGVTPAVDAHLRELGIRTVAELAETKPNTIQKAHVVTPLQAKALVKLAQTKLKHI